VAWWQARWPIEPSKDLAPVTFPTKNIHYILRWEWALVECWNIVPITMTNHKAIWLHWWMPLMWFNYQWLCFPSSTFLHVPIAFQICVELFGSISPKKKGWCGWLTTTMSIN
jgi:hypothetical protein